MAVAIRIDDPTDPRLDEYRGLRDPEGRRRSEAQAGIFVAEGLNVLGRLLTSRYPVRSVLVLPSKVARVEPMLDGIEVPLYVVDRAVMVTIAGFDLHRGVVAVAGRGPDPTLADALTAARTVLVLEGLNDPENLGAIARSANALGVDALVVDPTCVDHLSRRTVRVSMGEVLFLPVVRIGSIGEAFAGLVAAGFEIAALSPGAAGESLFEWSPPHRVALAFGAEGPGLTEGALAGATRRLRIPMRSDVDSLNVGHAVAVTLGVLADRRRQ